MEQVIVIGLDIAKQVFRAHGRKSGHSLPSGPRARFPAIVDIGHALIASPTGEQVEQRFIKVGLAFTVGMLAGLWAINNLLNWETAQGAVAYALSQENQSGYSARIIPPITSSSAATLGLLIIILTEATAGSLALFGAWRMWSRRKAPTAVFAEAKRFAILGSGIALLNWFLGFQVIGGTAIMMGQAEGMEGAMRGAGAMASSSFLTLIYLSMSEPPHSAN
jgi:predicted small integral membrane protein